MTTVKYLQATATTAFAATLLAAGFSEAGVKTASAKFRDVTSTNMTRRERLSEALLTQLASK